MKLATIKMGWTKSASTDVDHIEVVVNKDGTETTTQYSAEIESVLVEFQASTSGWFKVLTYDADGLVTASDTYTFTVSDLEAPLPATGLFHQIVSVREVADEPPVTPVA